MGSTNRPDRRPGAAVAAVCLAVLLALAGCNLPGESTGGTPPVSVTPAEVPEDRPPDTLAPGLTRDRIVDAGALADAHAALLENRSVRVATSRRTRAADGTVLGGVDRQVSYGPNRSRYALASREAGPRNARRYADDGRRRAELYGAWTNGSVLATREVRNGTEAFHVRGVGRRDGARLADRLAELRGLLDGLTVVGVRAVDERDGRTRYRITGRLADGDERFGTMTALVDARGYVHEYRTTERRPGAADGGVATVERRVSYGAPGAATVDRPDWVDRALGAAAGRDRVAHGATAEGVVDRERLASARRDLLPGQSVTLRRSRVRRGPDGAVRETENATAALRVAADRTAFAPGASSGPGGSATPRRGPTPP